MTRFFRPRGGGVSLNIAEAIEASPRVAAFRNQLAKLHGPRAYALVEDMMMVVMRHADDYYIAVRGAHLDRVLQLRESLDLTYRQLMNFGPDRPSARDIDAMIANVARQADELDAALRTASKPVEPFELPPAARDDLVQRVNDRLRHADDRPLDPFPEQSSQAFRPHDADFADGSGRLPGHPDYDPRQSRAFRKDWAEDPASPGTFRRTFADGSSAQLKIENGRYVVTSKKVDGTVVVIRERSVNVEPYAWKTPTTSLLNAHHGVQAAPMSRRFGRFGYDPDHAPTIWLRNSRAGSEHGRITAIEGRTGLHPTEPGSKLTPAEMNGLTYAQMRATAAREMATVGLNEAEIRTFLAAHDRYFTQHILDNIPQAERAGLLGNWTPAMQGAMP